MDVRHEGVAPELYAALPGLRGQNRYRKLHHDDKGPRRIFKNVKLGGAKVWRLRIPKPNARLLLNSPILVLERLRDAYEKMMISFAAKGKLSGPMFGGSMYTGKGNLDGQTYNTREKDFIKAYIAHLKQSGHEFQATEIEPEYEEM